ncbi:hypothetical protein [Flavobacterium sp. FlaQc-28]|jgi:hypothetical protein
MNANTGVWIGLGVLGAIIIASMSDETKPKPDSKSKEKPSVEPKKVQL